MKKKLLIGVSPLVLLLALLMSYAIGVKQASIDLQVDIAEAHSLSNSIGEESYYRALWDLCVDVGRGYSASEESILSVCSEQVSKLVGEDWYGDDSWNWSWPLPAYEGE